MLDIIANLTMAEVTAWVVVVALNAYVLFGGADFGGGVWDLFASGPRREQQRTLISKAIGPIWEANHVWLIVVVVVLFVCFPPAFAAFGTILHIPLSLMLIGIVLRGSAFIFRSYSYGPRSEQRRWGQVFAVSSLITPVVLGMCVGAVVSGGVGAVLAAIDTGSTAVLPTSTSASTAGATSPGFVAIYVVPWVSPFTIAVGALTLALFSFLAATYLTVEAEGDAELQDDFRRRALWAAGAAAVAALIALALGAASGGVMARLVGVGWSLPLLAASGVSAVAAAVSLVRRHYRFARIAAAGWVTLILWGWAMAQFPLIIPPSLTIDAAAAPTATLEDNLAVLAGGAVILIPSLWYLLRVFKAGGRRPVPPAG
jgi:cytochrome bd ubiquinol oxidase subunit II